MSPSNKKKSKSKSTLLSTDPLPTNYTISFATFICQANLSDINCFFEAAGSSQEGINLRIFWGRAFAEGKKVGQEKEYNRGYNEGYSDACEKDYKTTSSALSALKVSTTDDASTQTTPHMSPTPSHTSLNPTAPSLNPTAFETRPATANSMESHQEIKKPPVSDRFSWADDASALPTSPTLPHPPRDLSCLRSTSTHPFSSLQRKRGHPKNRRPRITQRLRVSHWPGHTHPWHHLSHPYTPSPVLLNWDQDPRLADLSKALRALGWVQQ